jgi:excisionase family DNA binding protein
VQTNTITPRALTTAEAARRLNVKTETVRKLIHAGRIPACRVSSRGDFRISRAVLDEFLLGEL